MAIKMMGHAGFPKSCLVNALDNSLCLKNRVFCNDAGGVPYELITNTKSVIYHIRSIVSLFYRHVPRFKRK